MAGQRLTLPELQQTARGLWAELAPGAVVWLTGELGSGKTTFVQALVGAAGGEAARSPSFALVHEYASPAGTLAHVDCYRLREPGEAIDLDFPGLQSRTRLLMVEWPERAGSYTPPADAHFHFTHGDRPDRRYVERRR